MRENDGGAPACGLQLLALLDRPALDKGESLYSLIDGAKLDGVARIRLPGDHSVELYSLLGELAEPDALYAGPILLRHMQREKCPLLAKLLCTAGSAHFMSLIVSGQPLQQLLERLTWLTEVVHDDGTEWIMRYYDPLILPHWLDVLETAQRKTALAGITGWLYKDVRGVPQIVPGEKNEAPAPPGSECMLLTQHQYLELMHRAAPYMLMKQMESDDPQALDGLPPDQRYDFFFEQLGRAQAYGLSSPTDLKSYCMLSLMLGADFHLAPLAAIALQAEGTAQSFSDRILAWTPGQWAALEEVSASNMNAIPT
ncbi:DUF4123 domain-containing protein [Janthinobacterium sp. NKUCC06_STL]|uniref:DUF4123 domain-containing protein n=1 Tax=Janthinobacterium sp. NKUCC06_STL TaxID=2842127 RepID=UPI001C5A75C1|nr:DUF4123 domain-containing protein [Janthinobacterium sp. NKUCC06_STL]MBW3511529.1 DUF4123 domain-containing protein [Janthinobacterium sp. NKUCC06_STL]